MDVLQFRSDLFRAMFAMKRHRMAAGYTDEFRRDPVRITLTSSGGWADIAYWSKVNETRLNQNMLTCRIQRREPNGKPMSGAISWANGRESPVSACKPRHAGAPLLACIIHEAA